MAAGIARFASRAIVLRKEKHSALTVIVVGVGLFRLVFLGRLFYSGQPKMTKIKRRRRKSRREMRNVGNLAMT